jgi:hypothetical protein
VSGGGRRKDRPTPGEMMAEGVNRILEGVRGFAVEMREKGIHVGVGSPPKCATCAQAWPCDQAVAQ